LAYLSGNVSFSTLAMEKIARTTQNDNNDRGRSTDLELSKLLSLVTAVAFATSLCYDLGYFLALKIPLGHLPTTIADHVRSAITWLPASIGLILGLGWAFVDIHLDLVDKLQILVPRQIFGRKNKRRYDLILLAIGIVLNFAFAFALYEMHSVGPLLGLMFLMNIWLAYFLCIRQFTRVGDLPTHYLFAIYIVPLIAIACGSVGVMSARGERFFSNNTATVVTKSDADKFKDVRLLRQYERVILVLTPANNFAFISRDEVIRIEFAADRSRTSMSGLGFVEFMLGD
jgi:hypothetical protein